MQLIIGAFIVLLVAMFLVAHQITMAFDEKELPKIVGAAFGASFSAAVAILLFYLSRARDEERSQSESLKFQKAHWQEVWAMMPSVYQEMVYCKANSGEQPMPPGQSPARSVDVIVEHLHSEFFDATIESTPRLSMKAQNYLLIFHDNLRVVRERLRQVFPILLAYESNKSKMGPRTADEMLVERDQEQDIGVLSKEMAEVIESALLYGWAAQKCLDPDEEWRREYETPDLDYIPRPNSDWIGAVTALSQRRARDYRALPDDVQ
jgi:hypothetical protein